MNKKGFTIIELLLAIVIINIFSVLILGQYKYFFNNTDNVTAIISSKITLEKKIATNTPIDGFSLNNNRTLPYIIFDNQKILYTDKSSNCSTEQSCLFENHYNYTKNNDNDIQIITTGLTNNIVYFNQYGIPVNQSGNSIEFNIDIKKKFSDGTFSNGQTIKVNKLGEIQIVKLPLP